MAMTALMVEGAILEVEKLQKGGHKDAEQGI